MELLLAGCQVLIGVVFAVSAFTKLRSRTALRSFASSLAMLPARVRFPAAVSVAAAEAAVAVLVVIPQVGLPLGGVLLGVFSVVIAVSIRRGLRLTCRCFGFAASTLGPVHLARNSLLLAFAVFGWAAADIGPADPPSAAGMTLAVSAGLVGAIIMIAFDDIVSLFMEPSGGV
ncbi:MauE/DoxX family redox-associated membrane protein [Nonomuraea sp. B19D2]|uniref:MauE/DoxX family redox-associated membrane protein n=1 Tax=Nonomuraea sp. B19D2 TaxID=3159561 RepID=UPI0032DB48E4